MVAGVAGWLGDVFFFGLRGCKNSSKNGENGSERVCQNRFYFFCIIFLAVFWAFYAISIFWCPIPPRLGGRRQPAAVFQQAKFSGL